MVSKSHASRIPSIKDSLHVDGAAGALVAADGPVLVEGLGAVDGGLLHAGSLVEIVGVAVVVDGALVLASRARVVSAVALDDLDIVNGELRGEMGYVRSTRREGCESSRKRKGSRYPEG